MTLTQLRAYTRYLTGTDTNSYPNDTLTTNLNLGQDELAVLILEDMKGWRIGEKIAKANLVANQIGYGFPTDIVSVKRIEVDYSGNGQRVPVTLKTLNQTQVGTDLTTIKNNFDTANPSAYLSDGIYLHPPATSAVTDGLWLWYEVESTNLSNPGDTPVFIRSVHKYLCFSAARDYYISIGDQEQGDRMEIRMDKLAKKALDYYAERSAQRLIINSSSLIEDYENK